MSRTNFNELDKYTTYTYHFELHVCGMNGAQPTYLMNRLANTISEESTERNKPNGTLLINSRFDTHQSIDNLVFTYLCPGLEPDANQAATLDAKITMQITEPGPLYFIDKLRYARDLFTKASDMSGLVFFLKIIFVGRKPNNEIDIIKDIPPMVLFLKDINCDIDHRGSEYDISFNHDSTGSSNQPGANPHAIVSDIHIKASNTQEAFIQIEQELNATYKESIKRIKINENDILIEYRIKADPELISSIVSSQKDNNNTPKGNLTFEKARSIKSCLRDIIDSSPDIMEKEVAASKLPATRRNVYGSAYKIIITDKIIAENNKIIYEYSLSIYKGIKEPQNVFEYDYIYSKTGKNTDVIKFDMKLHAIQNHLLAGDYLYSPIYLTNHDGKIINDDPDNFAMNIVHKDIIKSNKIVQETAPKRKDELDNDIYLNRGGSPVNIGRYIPPQADIESNSNNISTDSRLQKIRTEAVVADYQFKRQADGSSIVLIIRGDPVFLRKSNKYASEAFGTVSGLLVRVNVYDEEGRKFAFTERTDSSLNIDKGTLIFNGKYMCQTLICRFNDGQFIQELGLIEMAER